MFRSTLTKTVLNTKIRPSSVGLQPVVARAYHEKVISHYESPRNVSLFRSLPSFFRYLIANFTGLGRLPQQKRH